CRRRCRLAPSPRRSILRWQNSPNNVAPASSLEVTAACLPSDWNAPDLQHQARKSLPRGKEEREGPCRTSLVLRCRRPHWVVRHARLNFTTAAAFSTGARSRRRTTRRLPIGSANLNG